MFNCSVNETSTSDVIVGGFCLFNFLLGGIGNLLTICSLTFSARKKL